MGKIQNDFVLHVLEMAPDLTLATIRPEGYPQATTVSFAHDGVVIYAGIGRNSQKAENIRGCSKVSLTITLPYHDWREIRGLSMSATAELLDDPLDATRSPSCGSGRRWCR
jgi:general stress protein 26